jgi:D-sedoheptulose 7-phosphate isomerase
VKTPDHPSIKRTQSCERQSSFTTAHEYFQMYKDVVAQLPYSSVDEIINELLVRYEQGRAVFLFGNGGSASLASHMACDLGKGTIVNGNSQARFRVMALTDNIPLMTAWANDASYERIFAEQLQNLIYPGDVAFAISASGNSPNVLAALQLARSVGAITMGLAGFQGGKMKGLCDYCVIVPSSNMQIIEDFHLSVAHAIFSVIRDRIFEGTDSSRVFAKATSSD